MSTLKRKLKVPFEVHQEIKQLKGTLPRVPRFQPDGNVMTVPKQKTMLGMELIAEGVTKVEGNMVDPKMKYIRKYRETVYLNHEIEMIEAYKQGGQEGLDKYINYVHDMHEQIEKYKAEELEKAAKKSESPEA